MTLGGACVVGGSRHQPSRRQHAQELLQVASDHQSRDGRPSQPSRRGHSSYQVFFFLDSRQQHLFLCFFFFPVFAIASMSLVGLASLYVRRFDVARVFAVYLARLRAATTLHFFLSDCFISFNIGLLSTPGRYNICTRVNEPCSTLGIYP